MTEISSGAPTQHSGTFKLNPEQQSALDAMQAWVSDPRPPSPFFVLEGYAGTGKTFTCKALVDTIRGRVCFTAPTNKAVKVLRQTLTRDTYRPECATTYSLLGLQMVANGEVKELKGKDKEDDEKLNLANYKVVVVDEGSMVNELLMKYITEATEDYPGLKFLFMGDPAQLPPVKELRSPIWNLDNGARLTKVMRHDNSILNLVTAIRQVVDHPAPTINLLRYGKDGEVVITSPMNLQARMRHHAEVGALTSSEAKIIAWRNVKVDEYNNFARQVIFGVENARIPFLLDDRVIFTGPAMNLDDRPMARTDDEGTVMSVDWTYHPVYPDWRAIRLGITLDDSRVVTAFVLDPTEANRFKEHTDELASMRRWRDFWEIKEAFHGLRHAYAITAHRAQGSTYKTVLVDYRDVLLNRNRQEAYRCLYVACSRPTTELWLG